MQRDQCFTAIILSQRPVGEIHAGVTLLTEYQGMVSAIAHGVHSARGSLRGKIAPFTIAEFDLYHDPVKNRSKITDVVIETQLPGIRENIERYFTASLWAEIILKTHGGGEASSFVYSLLYESLHSLSMCDPRDIRRRSIQFLLRWLDGVGGIEDRQLSLLSAESLMYVHTSLRTELQESFSVALPEESQRQLLGWCYRVLYQEIELELNTLRTGRGIIV
ncbi:MAG: DNA repair protein RecO [Spirochaeta sp.]